MHLENGSFLALLITIPFFLRNNVAIIINKEKKPTKKMDGEMDIGIARVSMSRNNRTES